VISGADGRWIGAQVVYPNYGHQLPSARETFLRYDPYGVGWRSYGAGTVSADGKQIVPDAGARIYDLTGAMINSFLTPPANGP
jgi:hypothetical protein